jgi:hypothetical protein
LFNNAPPSSPVSFIETERRNTYREVRMEAEDGVNKTKAKKRGPLPIDSLYGWRGDVLYIR